MTSKAGWVWLVVLTCGVVAPLRGDAPAKALYANDFEALPEGKLPADILVLNGEWTIRKVEGNGVIELPGDPLDTMGVLVGPADRNAYTVTARGQSAVTGRRFPEFGVGACGPGQYRLWLMPAVGELQLIRGEDVRTAAPFAWKSGQWVRFKLQVEKVAEDKFRVRGKAWADGGEEPKGWQVEVEDGEAPPAGRACLLSTPFSGQATRFDDVVVVGP